MARKHVEEYYQRMVSDYTESKRILAELEACITEENASKFMDNLTQMKERVALLESNYKRLSYVMFLLNQPTKPKKKNKYFESEKKKLMEIGPDSTQEAIVEENKGVISDLKSYL